LNSIPKTLAIDRYISILVASTRTDSRVVWLATEIAHKCGNQLLIDGRFANGLAAAYLYFSAILLGVNLNLSSITGITDFEIRSRCNDLLPSFKISVKVKPETYKRHHE
jgi:transcription initiation factor TFIIIB Brf1 subunit/transcription initiation factor TFIIB